MAKGRKVLGRVLKFLHNHTERSASQSSSLPSPQQRVESGAFPGRAGILYLKITSEKSEPAGSV